MTSLCLDRKEVRHTTASAQYWTGLAGGDTGHLFLTFGGPVHADRISNCPLDRVLTYKNLIYLLNLQIPQRGRKQDRFFSEFANIIHRLKSLEDKDTEAVGSCTSSYRDSLYVARQPLVNDKLNWLVLPLLQ